MLCFSTSVFMLRFGEHITLLNHTWAQIVVKNIQKKCWREWLQEIMVLCVWHRKHQISPHVFILENSLGRAVLWLFKSCLDIKWAWFALSGRCCCIPVKNVCWACVQKMYLFMGMTISAEINWSAGYSKVTQGWAILCLAGILSLALW